MPDEQKPEPDFIKNSPLYEADPKSLDELFSRIDQKLAIGLPREITENDINRVVDYFWRERERFVKDQANFIKPGRRSNNQNSNSIKAIIERVQSTGLKF